MPALGFNPMRWDCQTQGCFNKKCRPKIEVFAECFPRRINFGDVDGSIEINGYELKLEWKNTGHADIKGGQRATVTRYLNKQRLPKPEIMLAIQDATDGAVAPADWYPEPTGKAA
ncbi:hypothetical protein CMI47_03685 [Candidatus Pacearchaeota archaeon]|nr:hypothetical protein [Candidatus Pacearchaeota archaeon]